MKLKRKVYYVFIAIALVFIIYIFISILWINNFGAYYYNKPDKMITNEEICTNSGGTIITQQCCKSANDFPDTCLIGACGCSPDNSKEVKVCDCGEGRCWKATEGCIPIS